MCHYTRFFSVFILKRVARLNFTRVIFKELKHIICEKKFRGSVQMYSCKNQWTARTKSTRMWPSEMLWAYKYTVRWHLGTWRLLIRKYWTICDSRVNEYLRCERLVRKCPFFQIYAHISCFRCILYIFEYWFWHFLTCHVIRMQFYNNFVSSHMTTYICTFNARRTASECKMWQTRHFLNCSFVSRIETFY